MRTSIIKCDSCVATTAHPRLEDGWLHVAIEPIGMVISDGRSNVRCFDLCPLCASTDAPADLIKPEPSFHGNAT